MTGRDAMLALILAMAAAAGPPAAAAPGTVSAVVVSPRTGEPVAATIEMGAGARGRDGSVTIWPGDAYRAGLEGHVVLTCRIDARGLAELCGVKSETPAGKGFGAAALQLRPTFKLKPATGPDGPVESQVDIAVNFRPPVPQAAPQHLRSLEDAADANRRAAAEPVSQAVTLLSHPVWAQAPGFDEVANAYPAKAGGAEGYVVVHCQVLRSGELKACVPVKETPGGLGFAAAALPLAYRFKVIPALAAPPTSQPLWVDIPIRLPPPGPDQDRTILRPDWMSDIAALAGPELFPREAAARGLTSGVGVAQCVVGPDGGLTQCAPEPGAPDGLGFSESVARFAATLKVALWSADAGPVYGGRVRLELRIDKGG